jgi:hypothetical protein
VEDNERYKKAKERVEAIKSFYGHLFIYIMVNIGLFLINYIASPGDWWFYWPLVGWGIGLAAHGVTVFGTEGVFGKDWEERKIRQIMEKERRKDAERP